VKKAFVKTDPNENPEVIEQLKATLAEQGVSLRETSKRHEDIWIREPFLYFRNPYIRVEDAGAILDFHYNNAGIPQIKSSDQETISVHNEATGECDLFINRNTYVYKPSIEPLPVLVGFHNRDLYAELTLNSLLYNLRSGGQKLYIVLSQPTNHIREIALKALERTDIEVHAVESEKNLAYSFANFGSKFFKLDKFIHFEEDGILPEKLSYLIPAWTQQFAWRATTADYLSLRVSNINYTSEFFKSLMYQRGEFEILSDDLWIYLKSTHKMVPVGGLGCFIDCAKAYKDFKGPTWCSTDHAQITNSKNICIANVEVYHLGANQEMDYHHIFVEKRIGNIFNINHLQKGTDLRTKITKQIDLSKDWIDHD